MYPVSANFHTLAIQDAPKTRVRIYFIGDAVDCTDDNAVQTNGTLLIGKAGDTDSNGRIGQNGITFSEFFNPDKNIQVGAAVSSQIGMTLLNTDGALDNFQYGRCKVYLDVYDTANSSWLTCPMGVYIIDLPTKRKVQLVNATGYDQMQKLDEICDTWWSALNWSGGITLSQLLTSLATQIGVSVSSNTASAIVNGSVSFTEEPFQCVEVTYREVLEYIAEATGTVARFDRNGALDLRWFSAAQISGNTVTVNTDTVGNQCLAISVAEYSVATVDLLKVKLYTDDIGITVGSGTNQYTIVNNLFLDGANSSAIIAKATPIYNRLHGLGAYSPVSARVIMDWSIEAGDIINIVNGGTTYSVPIFQQSMAWRGGYVVSDLLSDGDNVRPVLDYDERTYYRLNSEMSKKVGDDEIISKINQSPESITIQASKVNLTGYVTFTNLSTPGQTVIDGGNITTGTIDADVVNVTNINASNIISGELSANRISGGTLIVGGQNNVNGAIIVKDANGNQSGSISNLGVSITAYNNNRLAMQMGRYQNGGAYLIGYGSNGSPTVEIDSQYGTLSLRDANIIRRVEMSGDTGFFALRDKNGANLITVHSDPNQADFGAQFDGPVTMNEPVTMNSTLDVTPRRCYATLSSAGWYRVMKLTGSNTYEADGSGGFIVDFNIVRDVDSANNEAHKISLMATWGNFKFINEQSVSNALGITKIRTTNSGSNLYVDVYYDLSTQNTVTVAFNVTCRGGDESKFNSQPFTSVAPSPSGETVLPENEYTFIGTSGGKNSFTPSHGTSAFGGCWYSRNGEYVTVHVGLTGITANTNHIIGTLPVGYRPVSQCCSSGSSETYEQQAHLYVRENGNIDVWSPNSMASLDATFMWR